MADSHSERKINTEVSLYFAKVTGEFGMFRCEAPTPLEALARAAHAWLVASGRGT